MKFIIKLLLYSISFTLLILVLFKWDYELTRKVFFVWGIVSAYSFIFSLSNRRVKKKKGIPSYVD